MSMTHTLPGRIYMIVSWYDSYSWYTHGADGMLGRSSVIISQMVRI